MRAANVGVYPAVSFSTAAAQQPPKNDSSSVYPVVYPHTQAKQATICTAAVQLGAYSRQVLYGSKGTSVIFQINTNQFNSNQIHRKDLFRSSTVPIEPSLPRQMCLAQTIPIDSDTQHRSSAMEQSRACLYCSQESVFDIVAFSFVFINYCLIIV